MADTPKPIADSYPPGEAPLDSTPFRARRTILASLPTHFLIGWIGGIALLFFLCSSARHLMFQSTAFDLGIYDQVVYLMSQGLSPISSYLGFHHLGNHAAYSVYPLALLYKLYPSVYWLLLVQAISLSLGALPTWMLARQAGLTPSLSMAMVAAYWLYPLVFNLNLFDFHPEVMALPVILTAIWAARAGKVGWFVGAIVFILGCKGALSLMVAAMGLWLLVFEKRRACGLFALITGCTWFLLTTQWIIPTLSGAEAAAVSRYAYLGDSVVEIAQNLVLKPGLVLGQVASLETVKYLAVLTFPLIWGLSPLYGAPLVSAIPTLTLNLLSQADSQRDLVHQYSLPILPFLLVVVIDTFASGHGWLRQRRWIIVWLLVSFMILGKYDRFHPEYTRVLDTWQASRTAIARIPAHTGGVIADNYLGPHLSQREYIYLPQPQELAAQLPQTDYVLLNLRHPFPGHRDRVEMLKKRIEKRPEFQLDYQQDDVYLFVRRSNSPE